MPRIRQDNDARYALRASFVDENGDVITGDTILIPSSFAEADTLDSVTGRGNTTTNSITVGVATADEVRSSQVYSDASSDRAGFVFGGSKAILPSDNTGSATNGEADIGRSANAFKDGYFTGTVTAGSFSGDGSALTGVGGGITGASNVNITGSWEWQDSVPARWGNGSDFCIQWNGSDAYLRSYGHGGRILMQGEDSSGTNRALFYLDPDGEASIFHAGGKKAYTYGSGWRVTGNLLATGDVYAYYSDERLKDVVGAIERPLESIGAIDTFYYTHNDKARELGYEGSERQVGVSAQSVQAVLPEVIGRAPIDDDGEGGSVTGEDYITVKYERIVPLLIEGIKELTSELESVKLELKEIRDASH